MKCWECKKKIDHCHRVFYCDKFVEKGRDVCDNCYKQLKFNPCHFAEVKKITGRQLGLKFYKVKIMHWL
jgi:hypothetical protein